MKFLQLIITTGIMLPMTSCVLFKQKEKKEVKEITEVATLGEYKDECDNEDRICTMDYRAITVTIDLVNIQQEIDDMRLVFTESIQNKIKVLKPEQNDGKQLTVVLASDSDMKQFKMKGERVLLQLRSQNKVIAEKEYFIGHDCCHIKLISGDSHLKL